MFDNTEEPEGFSSESGSYLKMFLVSLSSPGYRMRIRSDFHNKTRKKRTLFHKVESWAQSNRYAGIYNINLIV